MQVEEFTGELGVDLPLVAWRRLQKPPALRASDRGSLCAGSAELGRRSCGASSHARAASTCAGVVPHGKGVCVCVWRVYLRLTGVDVVGGLDHTEGMKGRRGILVGMRSTRSKALRRRSWWYQEPPSLAV